MLEAIHQGLLYGIIAGFGVTGFALTIVTLYGIIEGISWIIGVHEKFFTEGDYGSRGRKD